MKTIFTTPRLIIRHFAAQEADVFVNMNTDERIARFITRRTPEETRVLFHQVIEDYKSDSQLGRWAIITADTQEFIGSIMLLKAREGLNGVEIGYSLIYKYWGQGFATEAVKAAVNYAFNKLKVPEICAITTTDNESSQGVLTKAGFAAKGIVPINGAEVNLYTLLSES